MFEENGLGTDPLHSSTSGLPTQSRTSTPLEDSSQTASPLPDALTHKPLLWITPELLVWLHRAVLWLHAQEMAEAQRNEVTNLE